MTAARATWSVLDTTFGDGSQFHACWQQWRNDPQRPAMLHYVGIQSAADHYPWPAEVARFCNGLGSGFHRILLDDGQVSLTLCIGPLQSMLAEQALQADTVLFDGSDAAWDKWALKALAKLCRRGTLLRASTPGTLPAALLEDAGFCLNTPAEPQAPTEYRYDPRWNLMHSRKSHGSATVSRCAVIGAGMAGASVAHVLALRGWAVSVLDACAEPAGGASGLPVGLVVPHVSVDDSPRSRMSRNGTRLMLLHAQRLLVEGLDWGHTGVMERRGAPEGDLWHPMAGWIKPARLVQEWLRHPAIAFVGNAPVRQLTHNEGVWTLHGDQGQLLAQAEHVVFANAYGCRKLLHSMASTVELEGDVLAKSDTWQELHGLLSYGMCPADPQRAANGMWPTGPVNGDGSFVPNIHTLQGLLWFAGSTFETQTAQVADIAEQHRANHARLASLLPEVGAALAPDFAAGTVQAWSATRCATHDRLPLVGPLQTNATPSLWINAGMGSRGLSFSALCAELLASQMHGEPLPVEAQLARGLDSMRARRQRRTTTETQTF